MGNGGADFLDANDKGLTFLEDAPSTVVWSFAGVTHFVSGIVKQLRIYSISFLSLTRIDKWNY